MPFDLFSALRKSLLDLEAKIAVQHLTPSSPQRHPELDIASDPTINGRTNLIPEHLAQRDIQWPPLDAHQRVWEKDSVKRIKRGLYAAEYGEEQLESGEVFGELEDRGEHQEEQGGMHDHHNEGVMKDEAMAELGKDEKWTYTLSFVLGVYDQAIMTRLKMMNEECLMSVVYSALKRPAPHRGAP